MSEQSAHLPYVPNASTVRVATLLARVVAAQTLMPEGHPSIARACEELRGALGESFVTMGVSKQGWTDEEGVVLGAGPEELVARLHRLGAGRLQLRGGMTSVQVLSSLRAMCGEGEELHEVSRRIAEASGGSARLDALALESLRAGGANEAGVLDEASGVLLRTLMAEDGHGLEPIDLAHAMSLSMRDGQGVQADAWRARLAGVLRESQRRQGEQSKRVRDRIVHAIEELDQTARDLLLRPDPSDRDKADASVTIASALRAHGRDDLVLSTLQHVAQKGPMSPEAVMLGVKLASYARLSRPEMAEQAEAALASLQESVGKILADPAKHGYSPEDYRSRLSELAMDVEDGINVPTFKSEAIDAAAQAASIAVQIVKQSESLGYDPTGSLKFLSTRAPAITSSPDDLGVAALADVLKHLPTDGPAGEAAARLRATLADTSCLMPLVRRAGREDGCEHALAIVQQLPEVPLLPLAEQYLVSGALGLERVLSARLRSMSAEQLTELTTTLTRHADSTPRILRLLSGVEGGGALAALGTMLSEGGPEQRAQVLVALAELSMPVPAGLVATALVDEHPEVVRSAVALLPRLRTHESLAALQCAIVQMDKSRSLSAVRLRVYAAASLRHGIEGARMLSAFLHAWSWTLMGTRPRACSVIAEVLEPFASIDPVVASAIASWSRSSSRFVEWLMPGRGAA